MNSYSENCMFDLKLDLSTFKPICRCCLNTNKPSYNDAITYAAYFKELAGITVSEADCLPLWLCVECSHLLKKAVKFKMKILHSHSLLSKYVARCAPFPIDSDDPELMKHSSPELASTEVLNFDNMGKGRSGFHKVLEHYKNIPKPTELVTVEVSSVSELMKQEPGVKEEMDMSDYEDNIPLEEFKSSLDKMSEESFVKLLQDDEAEIPKKKKKRKDGKEKKKRKESSSYVPVTSRVRRPIDIDPEKIMIVDLDPIEQVNQRKEESEGYMKLPYKCELCYKGFNFQDKLDNHMKKHSPSRGKFECRLCRMFLPTPHSYSVHMLIHTRRYECRKCGRRMVDRSSIVEHYRGQHEGIVAQYTCQLCGKISSNSKTHRGHMRNHHSGDRPKCDECGKTFINKDSLAEHLLIHLGIKNHECGKCQMRFRTKTQLKYHQLKHTDVKDFYCVECDARFKSAHNLRQHLLKSLKHKDVKSFKFPCGQCDKRFETSARREAHVAVQHQRARPHTCDACGAALSTRASLLKHVRSHRAPPPPRTHVCHACGRAFAGASNLANHARTHTGEKPFSCARCGRAFSQRTAMLTHVKLVHLKVTRGTKVKPEILEPEKAPKFEEPEPRQPEQRPPEPRPHERQIVVQNFPGYDSWINTNLGPL